jgi:hypothetical protein
MTSAQIKKTFCIGVFLSAAKSPYSNCSIAKKAEMNKVRKLLILNRCNEKSTTSLGEKNISEYFLLLKFNDLVKE